MQSDTQTLTAADGTELHLYRWSPEDRAPKAIVQIAHGMAEHAGRYDRFAHALTEAGYVVYANDHRGHGQTNPDGADHGYFAKGNGFDVVVNDMGLVARLARGEHPDVPLFLFGHSMGSFLSRAFAARRVEPIDGLILSGTAGDPGPLAGIGRTLAGLQAKLRGPRHRSGLMDTIVFSQNNSQFKPARTKFDWLSRDPEEVDAYINDPLCGNVFSAGFYQDLLGGLSEVVTDDNAAKVPNNIPILVLSGDRDPVGDNGKGPQATADQYSKGGSTDVTLNLYPEGRHEMLNETNRDEVTVDIITWLDTRTKAATTG